ncbi:MAG: PAS domain-containing protein, partial [Caldilineaceae bacterium]|nr:PAS domain-containing protein [Caldilineaceae bacterium]
MLTVRESIAKPQTSDYEAQVRALEEQVAFYQSVINALPDPLFVKDEEHRVILVNEAHCQLVGLPAAEILANDNVDPTPRDEQAVFWSQDTLALTSDQPVENEETLTDHQGHRHIISTRKVGHRLPNGKKIVIGTTRDITHRREIEERLHHEQALLRQLLDSIPDFIFYKNMDNRYVGCNRAFELLAGCSEAELVGLNTAAIFPEVAHREFEQQDAIVLHEKRTLRTEQWVSYPDG